MALKLSGMVSGMDTDSMVAELMKAQNLKKTKITNKITTSEWTQDKWKALNTKIYSLYTGSLSKIKMQSNYSTKLATSSDDTKLAVTASVLAPAGTHTLKIEKLASAQFVTGAKLGNDVNGKAIATNTKLTDLGFTAGDGNKIKINVGGTEQPLTITDTSTVSDVVDLFKNAGLNASYDTTQKRFFVSSKASGYENAFSLSAEGSVDLSKLGLNTITNTNNGDGTVTVTGGGAMTLVKPSDAKILYNGAEITSASNNISVNGLSLSLKGLTQGMDTPDDATDDKSININVENNTKAVHDSIKDFIKGYNSLITEMNDDYYAVSSKGYDPLTDDQKAAMTDGQIESWEGKIKDSLLRRDDTLKTLLANMRTTLGTSVQVEGKAASLSTYGIVTGNYTEKGLLHIEGDEDDSSVSGLEDKLMTGLTNEPDKVMKVITELASNLYKSLSDSMKGNSLRSALTIYNDKEITNSITTYKSDLTAMETKLSDMESRYYKQFSKMETAMSKLNSQSSSLTSMLGK